MVKLVRPVLGIELTSSATETQDIRLDSVSQLPPLGPRSRYRFAGPHAKDLSLPFIRRIKGRTYPHYWQPAEPKDELEACALGRQYAAHLAQMLKLNRQHSARGLLFRIASDMDFRDRGHRRSMCKSFFNYLEILLNLGAQQVDLAQHVEALQRFHLSLDELETLQRKPRRKKRS
ncbi:hypothetical protein HNO92_001934 [Chromobacterium alkanivorans]|uniref:hypothetical protein n=1 Tax=Chromobacterium alkanivorans TaxID=1071719 RepID=UPI002166F5A0|nr:hypothetical protein [Chromobacterium alkanivorans]MCS3804342.1 hypothetical protein [Chromobacterium alkanivorans]MCS3818438.1 hypothetical protein [Chromobacterium alkanivorans]MCS3873626.1 hypothetical protein [Chromobacterium alkanivorans]